MKKNIIVFVGGAFAGGVFGVFLLCAIAVVNISLDGTAGFLFFGKNCLFLGLPGGRLKTFCSNLIVNASPILEHPPPGSAQEYLPVTIHFFLTVEQLPWFKVYEPRTPAAPRPL